MLVSVWPRLIVTFDREIRLPEWKAPHSAAARQVLQQALSAAIPGFTIIDMAWDDDDGGYEPPSDPSDPPDRSRYVSHIDQDTGEPVWVDAPPPVVQTPPLSEEKWYQLLTDWEMPPIRMMVDVPEGTTHDDLVSALYGVFQTWKVALRAHPRRSGDEAASIVKWVFDVCTNLDQRLTVVEEAE